MNENNRTDSRAEPPGLFAEVASAFLVSPATPATSEPTADPALDPKVWPLDAASNEGAVVAAAPADADSSGGLVGHLQSVADAGAGVIGTVIDVANMAFSIRDGPVARRLARQAREPLANLYELFPEARNASPHELGMRFVPVEEIRGTAVAGYAQRGGDFLPLRPFRGENWTARWQRLRAANERLQPLPPVDLIKYDGEYWVVDGHNRVAVTLYAHGVGLDAMVTELVPLDGQTSERPRNLLSYLGETGELRAAASGRRPAIGMRQVEQLSTDEAAVMPESEREAQDEADAQRTAETTTSAADTGIEPLSLGEAD
jgi:hypothetical protein